MAKPIIDVNNVSVCFNMAKEKTDTIKQYIIKLLKKQLFYEEFWALRNISFPVYRGDSIALVGRNGCGKSTMLKVIAGVLEPSKGDVRVFGRIAPLIELGAGFDGELTARENIYMNGAIMGHDRKFMNKHFDEIIDFSELNDFIDVPVKNFSSGMTARLGFSIATIVDADILIVDEVLSVGDEAFQRKCEKKMNALLDGGTTLVFVSHSTDQVKRLCRRAIWLDRGVVQMSGESKMVCDAYQKFLIQGK